MQQFIFTEEIAESWAPQPEAIATGVTGPTLIVHGTEKQQKGHLP